jgi:intein-encoded DNA endonuclease-like protein
MYMRGFFDAEGGVPRNGKRFYIQLAQKDYAKMSAVKKILREIGIESGKIHNPSKRVDPDYWRIFVPVRHHRAFAERIGSWHPVKSKIFSERMKI